MSGRVSLIHEGQCLKTEKYEQPGGRRQIIEKWRRLYGKVFKMEYVKDEPDGPAWKPRATKDERNDFNNAILR